MELLREVLKYQHDLPNMTESDDRIRLGLPITDYKNPFCPHGKENYHYASSPDPIPSFSAHYHWNSRMVIRHFANLYSWAYTINPPMVQVTWVDNLGCCLPLFQRTIVAKTDPIGPEIFDDLSPMLDKFNVKN